MAQTNYTPIYLYNSGTASNVPLAANLGAGELAINYADGKLFYKDGSATIQVIGWITTPTTAGGTGLTSYTAGDLPYYASGSALSKLGIGTANYVLTSSGTAPQYVAQSTLSVGSATNATNTAITDNTSSSATWYPTIVSATTGNLPQTTSSTKLSFVPSTGTLTATSHAGAWAGSTIGTGYGGTGLTSFTANGVVYASSSSVLATGSNLLFDGTNLLVGTATSAGRVTIKGTTTDNSTTAITVQDSSATTLFYVRNDGLVNTGASTNSPYNATTVSAANLLVTSSGTLSRAISSLKYKREVQDAIHGLKELLSLRSVTYKGKNPEDGEKIVGGLIAEEVHETGLTEFVMYAEDGSPDSLFYGNMVSLCVKAIQEQQEIITTLQTQVTALQTKVGV